MSTEQVIALSTSAQECPICMESFEGLLNRVVTECGHAFHCSCLMQNAAHNGFGCPYCRTKLAEEPEEEDDESEEEDDEESVFDEDALTSFRMFHQQLNGEEVEEEPADDWATVNEEDEDERQDTQPKPDVNYVTQKLMARGVTMYDLVTNILYQEHSGWGDDYMDLQRRSCEVYGHFRAVISQYRPEEQEPTPASQASPPSTAPAEVDQVMAEPKSVSIPRRREFMLHV